MIIGISGYAKSGKDTVGKIIQNLTAPDLTEYGYLVNGQWTPAKGVSSWHIRKFAAKLKNIASILLKVPIELFEEQEFKNSTLGPEWGTMVVREFLQKLGEGLRKGLHEDSWVNSLFLEYAPQFTDVEMILNRGIQEGDKHWQKGRLPNWIITDMRYRNEVNKVKSLGGITLRINRVGIKPVNDHISERDLDNYCFDYVINNDGTVEDLISKVREFLIKFQILKDDQKDSRQ